MPWHFICCRLVWHLGAGSEIPLLTYRAGSKRDALEKKAVLATCSTVCSHSVLGWCFWLAWGTSGAGLHVLPWLQTDIGVLVSASVHPEASPFPVKGTAWLFCVSCLSFLLAWDSPPVALLTCPRQSWRWSESSDRGCCSPRYTPCQKEAGQNLGLMEIVLVSSL